MEPVVPAINSQLVDSLIQVIQSLSTNEQALLLDKLLGEVPYPSTQEIMHLAEKGGSFDFWYQEPEIYTLEDGAPISWS